MRGQMLQAQIADTVFALCPRAMNNLLIIANQETPRAESVSEIANNSVTYEKQDHVAIISVDGGMYKKNVGGLCSSVASYDQMVKFIDKAESDPSVSTILFRVDTAGGSLAGADEVGEKIYNSNKRTVTLYENIGASGGIWVFSASDELYATETTMLGSIGVIVSYMEQDEVSGAKRVSIVSRNAENKDCSLKGNCKEKIQTRLDTYEAMFHARVERNTGFGVDQIKSVFNNGDVIFATEAQKAGFIKEVVTFDTLLSRLKSGASPTASVGNKSTKISHEGAEMPQAKSDSAIVAGLKSLLGIESSAQVVEPEVTSTVVDVAAISAELETVKSALVAQTEAHSALTNELTEAKNSVSDIMVRLKEAEATGVSVAVAIQMVEAASSEEASKIAIDSKSSQGVFTQSDVSSDGADMKQAAELAFAQALGKKLSI